MIDKAEDFSKKMVDILNHGAGLGMMWGRDRAEDMLREAGFEQIEREALEHDPFNIHFLCRMP